MYYWKCLIKLLETRKTRKERRHRRTSRDKPRRWPWHSQCPREMVCSSRTRKVLFNFRADRFSPERCHFVPNCTNFIPTDLISVSAKRERNGETVSHASQTGSDELCVCVWVQGHDYFGQCRFKATDKKNDLVVFNSLTYPLVLCVEFFAIKHSMTICTYLDIMCIWSKPKKKKNDPSYIFNLLTLTLSICSHHSRWLLVKKIVS